MAREVLRAIRTLLDDGGVAYRVLEHEPTPTSEDSARVRGEPLEIGGKALMLKVDDVFGLFVLSAARRLDSAAVKARLGAKRMRFATTEELAELTGLVPGAVPPFGEPVLSAPLYVDTSIAGNDRIAFNAGALTCSVIMGTADYVRVARPAAVFRFST